MDYLVKPLNVQRFEATLRRVRERLRAERLVVLREPLASLEEGPDYELDH